MKNLHAIGTRIAELKTETNRGREPYKLPGSSKLPETFIYKKPPKVKITRAPSPPDRFAPDADYEPHFAAYWPGVDPATGKPWGVDKS